MVDDAFVVASPMRICPVSPIESIASSEPLKMLGTSGSCADRRRTTSHGIDVAARTECRGSSDGWITATDSNAIRGCAELGRLVIRFDETMRNDVHAAAIQVARVHARRTADHHTSPTSEFLLTVRAWRARGGEIGRWGGRGGDANDGR